MQAGQVAGTFGMLGGLREDGGVVALGLRGEVTLSKTVGIGARMGAFLESGGKGSLRDGALFVPTTLLRKPSFTWRIEPGVTLPMGTTVPGFEVALNSTGTFDPTLSSSVVAGGTWLVVGQARGRFPLYAGRNRDRQGVLGRADARIGRRVASGAVTAGLSLAGQQTRPGNAAGFTELAAVVTGAVPLAKRWGLSINSRTPFWAGAGQVGYITALQVGVTGVFVPKG